MLSFFCIVVDMISNVMFKTRLMQQKKTKTKKNKPLGLFLARFACHCHGQAYIFSPSENML
jgi:hypothetical protein